MRAGWPWRGHPLPAGCLLPVDPEGPGDDGDHTVVFMVGKVMGQSVGCWVKSKHYSFKKSCIHQPTLVENSPVVALTSFSDLPRHH